MIDWINNHSSSAKNENFLSPLIDTFDIHLLGSLYAGRAARRGRNEWMMQCSAVQSSSECVRKKRARVFTPACGNFSHDSNLRCCYYWGKMDNKGCAQKMAEKFLFPHCPPNQVFACVNMQTFFAPQGDYNRGKKCLATAYKLPFWSSAIHSRCPRTGKQNAKKNILWRPEFSFVTRERRRPQKLNGLCTRFSMSWFAIGTCRFRRATLVWASIDAIQREINRLIISTLTVIWYSEAPHDILCIELERGLFGN